MAAIDGAAESAVENTIRAASFITLARLHLEMCQPVQLDHVGDNRRLNDGQNIDLHRPLHSHFLDVAWRGEHFRRSFPMSSEDCKGHLGRQENSNFEGQKTNHLQKHSIGMLDTPARTASPIEMVRQIQPERRSSSDLVLHRPFLCDRRS